MEHRLICYIYKPFRAIFEWFLFDFKKRSNWVIQFLFLTKAENRSIYCFTDFMTENQTIPISIRRRHSLLSVSYILCVELLVLLETQMQLIFLIQGLEKLEYRGYDSAGIFVLGGAESHRWKCWSAELSAKTAGVEGQLVSVAYPLGPLTGSPTKDNAFTRTALRQGRFVLVHNGDWKLHEIKGRNTLRVTTEDKADTEIIVTLIGKFTEEDGLSFLKPSSSSIIRGSCYALIDSENPDVIYVAKNKSPLWSVLEKATTWSYSNLGHDSWHNNTWKSMTKNW